MSVVSRSRMEGKASETARCLFCGVVGLWWTCGCEWSQKIAAGKLARPRTVMRGGVPVIILCEELRAAARSAGVITREYGRAGKGEVSGNAGETPVTDSEELRETAEVGVSPAGAVTDSGPVVTDSVGVTCVVCGKRFVPSRKMTAQYCSGACRMRAQRRK
jgi:hypothetical protein